jgi:hypothetical protein
MAQTRVDVPTPDFEELQKLLSNQKKISEEINKQLVKFEELQAVISEQAKISNELDKAVLGKNIAQIMINVKPEKVREVLITSVKKTLSQGMKPVVVLTTTNYESISKFFSESKIDINQILVIDCVTRNVYSAKNTKQVHYIDSLRNLTQLQIKIINFFEREQNSVFIFDSLDVLTLYHENGVIFKFMHSLTKIFRQRSLQAYFLFTDKLLIRQLSQFFDNVVEIE